MKTWLPILALAISSSSMALEFRSQPLELKLPDVTLRGSFEQPLTTAPTPVALIIAGSGPTDRDGNSRMMPGRNDSLKMLAQQLAAQGIATLRYDKRMIGESTWAQPDESQLRLDTYVNDADAWLAELARRGFAKPFLIGHSEGALLATLAAQRRTVAGVVLLAGAGRPADQILIEQLQQQAPQLVPESRRILNELKAGRLVADVPAELQALFRPSVQPYMQSWLRRDPALELARLTLPVLTISGDADLQVGAIDAAALAGVAGVQSRRIANMNHVLKQIAAADLAGQQASYSNPTVPLAPELVPSIVEFVRREAARQGNAP
ncbi:alpha/beta fold hydrolase [Permianibacter sp. IMCC34836]|uniref:alpha/beta hydrolase n=1 Tax=Permianibacter fluminis TaxID=2738515 RepID=UPI0015532225|nr:alpha/beta fold hydrolase [Permianibacter fluminis]NQD38372.1 alpha/beta fold hydrolase [Permianibacter fluminis]